MVVVNGFSKRKKKCIILCSFRKDLSQKTKQKGYKTMKIRKVLSPSGLYKIVRSSFSKIVDHRQKGKVRISLENILTSAFAMFSLKDPSLLFFDQRVGREKENLKRVYGIDEIACDTQMRTTLDPISPDALDAAFKTIFDEAQRGKVLEQFEFIDGHYIMAMDGTSYFTSKKIHCSSCLTKVNSTTGEVTYHHQAVGTAIVHPNQKAVIPLAPEPIIRQDGESKNDCERNASKRAYAKIRKAHPRLKLIITQDALSPNAPNIQELGKHDFRYLLKVKESDHKFLFGKIAQAQEKGLVTEWTNTVGSSTYRFRFCNQLPLNASNQDVKVNFLEFTELKKGKIVKRFTWVTDISITRENAYQLVLAGRAHWKIENETFNTLKNQGYQFEHNFGHGKKNLSVVLMKIMFLAFLVDQILQVACRLFQATWEKSKSKKKLWEHIRNLFYTLDFDSMEDIYRALLFGYQIDKVTIGYDT